MGELIEYPDLVQRSPEWFEVRCGIVTASTMKDLVTVASPDASTIPCPTCDAKAGGPCLAVGRKEPTAIKSFHDPRAEKAKALPPVYVPADNDTSKALILALAAERITAHIEETYPTRDMARGIFAEPYARDLYAEHCTDKKVTECGFMIRDFGGFKIGFSPDGLVGDDGLIEIKAPKQRGHLSTIVSGKVPAMHMAQLQTALLVSGRKWIDFISYNAGMHLWPTRVTADPAWHAAILAAAEKAERDIDEHIDTHNRAVKGLPLAERIDFFQEIF